MAGLAGSNNGSTTSGPSNAINSVALNNAQGVTAQGALNPVYLAENSASVGNSNVQVAAGSPNPEDKTPGYLAVAQPGGANVALVPGGNYNTDNQIQVFGAPAGTAGGGGYYPAGFQAPATAAVPNPMLAFGWSVQGNTNTESPKQLTVAVAAQTSGSHTVAGSVTPTISGGTSPYAVTTTQVNGLDTATLPTGFSLAPTTGALSWAATGTAGGTYTFAFLAKDSSVPAVEAEYSIEVVLS